MPIPTSAAKPKYPAASPMSDPASLPSPAPIRFITTSAVANATPMRALSCQGTSRIPTPTATAKTSSPSETATTKIFSSGTACSDRAGSLLPRGSRQTRKASANRRVFEGVDFGMREQAVHRGAQLRDRKRLVQEEVRAGSLGAAVHRVVRVAGDHQDGHSARAFVGAKALDQIDSRDARQHEVADDDVEQTFAIQCHKRALRIVADHDLVRAFAAGGFDAR